MSGGVWLMLNSIVVIYCLARGVVDVRRRAYVWGLLGLSSAGILALTPNPNFKTTITIPIAKPARAAS